MCCCVLGQNVLLCPRTECAAVSIGANFKEFQWCLCKKCFALVPPLHHQLLHILSRDIVQQVHSSSLVLLSESQIGGFALPFRNRTLILAVFIVQAYTLPNIQPELMNCFPSIFCIYKLAAQQPTLFILIK